MINAMAGNITEGKFIEEVKRSVKEMKQCFTPLEHIKITFVPLVYNYIAFDYAFRCKEYAVQKKISLLKHLSRSLNKTKDEYDRELYKDLNSDARFTIKECAEQFMAEYSLDFVKMYFSVKNEFNRQYPDYPYDDMRSQALCGILVIKLLREHLSDINKMIRDRQCEVSDSYINPRIEELEFILGGYSGVPNFDFSEYNVALATKIIKKRINQIEFNII